MVETMWFLLPFQWSTFKVTLKRSLKSSFIIKSQGLDIVFYITTILLIQGKDNEPPLNHFPLQDVNF